MASGSGSAAEARPPALPVKKHRSNSLSPSLSVDADFIMLGPVGLQHHTYIPNDVFSEPTDCHADRCPIHQRYDRFQHQERFFSDGTPPPIPRKQLARTLSLPGIAAPALSPLPPVSPLQTPPLDFDNPLYMLAPVPDTCFQEETGDVKPATSPPLPFSQLSFDTPDEHLPYLFRAIDDHRAVSQGIQHRHLLFLRSTAQSAEAEVLLQGEASEEDVGSYQPQDFLLCKGGEPKQMGDTVYYRLQSPKFPGRVLSLKVHKQTDGAPSAHNKHRSSHVNVQDVIAHFQPSNNPRKEPLMIGCTAPNPPHRGSAESSIHLTNTKLPSAQSFLLQGHSVSVERDLPHVTLEDFVHDSRSLQSSEGLGYDRQVCVLLVQILTGLQHLSNVSAAAAELRPRDILLVWPSGERDEGRSKMQRHTSAVKDGMEWEKTENKGPIQMLWSTRGSPRVVLTPNVSSQSGPHFLPSVKSQIVALIQFFLHIQGPSLSKSLYRRGLVYLLSLFQGENPGPQLADMVAMLQVLLWGPHVSLFSLRSYTTTAVHNWLTIKRALLVMKLAEKGLIQDQSALGWEDFMCLQYLSFIDPETIVSVTSQLWLNV